MFYLNDVLAIYGQKPADLVSNEAIAFSGVSIDSRTAPPNSLFVALPGERRDGHEFLEAALERGCRGALARREAVSPSRREALAAVIYEWDGVRWLRSGPVYSQAVLVLVPDPLDTLQRLAAQWRSRFSPVIIGITGSIGKSSTKELLGTVLGKKLLVLKSEKSYNNEIGLPLTLLYLGPQHQVVILEMGTYGPGEIAHLVEIARPRMGIVTNVSHSHLERMRTLETIAKAKSELPAGLPPDGLAILNGDEPLIRAMAAQTRARVVTYGQAEGCDWQILDVQSEGLAGISIRFRGAGEERTVRCAVPGRHSAYNAMAVIIVARALGLSWEEIQSGLLDPAGHLRLVPVPGAGGSTLIDDSYNASPVSSQAALDLMAELPAQRKVAILGDMLELGSFEETGHRQVGERAAHVVDELVVLGKRARWIGEAALEAGMPTGQVHFVASHKEAIDLLHDRLGPDDLVLIKGSRAMEMERIVAGLRLEE